MQTLKIIVLLLSAVSLSFAQETETLFNRPASTSFYGAPVVTYGVVNGSSALFVGGKGLWVINHAFGIGAGGYGLVNDVDALNRTEASENLMRMGYLGLVLECSIDPASLFHLTLEALIGGGDLHRGTGKGNEFEEKGDGFFVIEPAANVDLNVADNVRVGIGASYRFVGGLESTISTNRELSGLNGSFSVKIGCF